MQLKFPNIFKNNKSSNSDKILETLNINNPYE